MKKGMYWVLLVIGMMLIVNLSRSVYDMTRRGTVLEEAEQILAAARQENKRLTEEHEMVTSNYFVEKQARDKLNMARSDETVLLVPTVASPSPTPTPTLPKENWQLWREALRL